MGLLLLLLATFPSAWYNRMAITMSSITVHTRVLTCLP